MHHLVQNIHADMMQNLRAVHCAIECKVIGITLKGLQTAEWIREQTGVANAFVDMQKYGSGKAMQCVGQVS